MSTPNPTLNIRALPATLEPPRTPSLLERDAERRRIAALLRDARGGRGGAVSIEAAAGLGKTRLLAWSARHAAQHGMRVLSARATPLERDYGFGLVRQLLGPADAPPLAGDPGERLFAALQALYERIAELAVREPLLLVVDDAHWADPASLRLLAFLLPRLDGLPLTLAVGARPGADRDVPLAADPAVVTLPLAPLSAAASTVLLEEALGGPADGAFAAACLRLTGGNPFLVVELARTLAADAVAPTTENAARVAELVPETIVRATLARLGRLPAEAGALARAVAVLGDGCPARHAAVLAGIGGEDAEVDAAACAGLGALGSAADALRDAGIFDGGAPLAFAHPLARNAIYADLPAGVRDREHRRAAALLARAGEPPERVAMHLLATEPAGDPEVARALAEAARAAYASGAPETALAYLKRALNEPPRTDERPALLDLMALAAEHAADADALAPFEDELLAGLSGDRLLRNADPLTKHLATTGRVGAAEALLERAIAAAEAAGDLGQALSLEAQLDGFTQMPPAQARRRFDRFAGRLAAGSPEERLALGLRAWWSHLLGGSAGEAAGLARGALAGGRIFEEQPACAPAAQRPVTVLTRADALDEAAASAAVLVEVTARRGSAGGLSIARYLSAQAALRRGDVAAARADVTEAMDAARLGGFLCLALPLAGLVVDVLARADELDEAERELEVSGLTGTLDSGYWLGPLLFSRGRLRLAQGRFAEAAHDLLDLRERLRRWGIGYPGTPASAYAAIALAALGERERAAELAGEGLRLARRWGAPSLLAEALTAAGIAAAGDEATALHREAVAAAERSPARLVHAEALLELGAAQRRAGHAAGARPALRAALHGARRCGSAALARRAADELRAAGGRVGSTAPIGAASLSPSERRVAELVARGASNREAAAALHLTVKTIESHLRAAFDKLGVRSRGELAAALTRG